MSNEPLVSNSTESSADRPDNDDLLNADSSDCSVQENGSSNDVVGLNAPETTVSAQLDALDEQPENKKRASIILIVIGVLFVFAVVIIYLFPPLGWTPQKDVKSDYQTTAVVENVQNSENASFDIAYQKIEKELVYSVELEQVSHYSNDAFSKLVLHADVNISRPARRNYDDEIAIRLENVDVHIFDGPEREVNLASAGELLEGIYMFSRLSEHDGMSSIVPDANINPQVARMLFAMSDAVRQIWLPLPSQKIGQDASWRVLDVDAPERLFQRDGRTVVKSISDEEIKLETSYKLIQNENHREIGSGDNQVSIVRGVVQKAEVHFERIDSAFENGASKQNTTLKFELNDRAGE